MHLRGRKQNHIQPRVCLQLDDAGIGDKLRGIDLAGLERVPGKTFVWAGVYSQDMNDRETLTTDLNVFATFDPKLPDSYKDSPYLLLGNIQPALQRSVKAQMNGNMKLVGGDTMNYWIADFREELLKTIAKWDFLLINDSEARMLSGENNLRKAAAKIIAMNQRLLESLSSHPFIQAAVSQILASIADKGISYPMATAGAPIAIHPGSGSPAKCWPVDSYIRLIELLNAAGHSCRVILGEVERDRWPAEQIRRFQSVAETVQPTIHVELLGELSRCRAFIGSSATAGGCPAGS